jgi:hypothetical protein
MQSADIVSHLRHTDSRLITRWICSNTTLCKGRLQACIVGGAPSLQQSTDIPDLVPAAVERYPLSSMYVHGAPSSAA